MEQTQKRRGDSRMKVMWRLSWPAIIEQILATMVSYVDTAMVGVMGAAGTAAVSVNAAPIWLSGGLLVGVGVGYSVQVSNAIGAGDDERARQIIRQGVLATLVTGFLGLLLFQALAPLIPRWLGAKPEVLPQAVSYLRCYTMAMPFIAAGYIFSAILRCMGNTKAPLYFNTAANLINIVLNFFLIYPTRTAVLFGAPVTLPGAGLGSPGGHRLRLRPGLRGGRAAHRRVPAGGALPDLAARQLPARPGPSSGRPSTLGCPPPPNAAPSIWARSP